MKFPTLTNAKALAELVREIGFLPMFQNEIPGFSVEDLTPDAYWFKKGVIGPWEWREELAAQEEFAYGKLFRNKAGIVSAAWYPRFANFRRDGYDFDARCDEGLVPAREKRIYELVAGGVSRADELRAAYAGKGFEGAITHLQMQGYILVRGFVYKQTRQGIPYGWGVSEYMLPEERFGSEAIAVAYAEDPQASGEQIAQQVHRLNPEISLEVARKFIR